MLSLCIATGDDPEADSKTDENSAIGNKGTKITKIEVKNPKQSIRNTVICANCGEEIKSERVIQYSMERYHKPLCMNCQKQMVRIA